MPLGSAETAASRESARCAQGRANPKPQARRCIGRRGDGRGLDPRRRLPCRLRQAGAGEAEASQASAAGASPSLKLKPKIDPGTFGDAAPAGLPGITGRQAESGLARAPDAAGSGGTVPFGTVAPRVAHLRIAAQRPSRPATKSPSFPWRYLYRDPGPDPGADLASSQALTCLERCNGYQYHTPPTRKRALPEAELMAVVLEGRHGNLGGRGRRIFRPPASSAGRHQPLQGLVGRCRRRPPARAGPPAPTPNRACHSPFMP